MSRRTSDSLTTAALRDLDPGRSTTGLNEAERARADATFARIVATPDDCPLPAEPDRPRRARGPRRLLVPASMAGLAAAAGIAIPVLLHGGTAYGSWTPTPHPLEGDAASTAAATCRAALDVPDGDERVLLAEQRGEWTYVLLGGPDSEAACLLPDDMVGERDHAELEGEFFGRYDSEAAPAPHVARGDIVETESMTDRTDEGLFNLSEGYVGRDVVGVTVHTPSGLDVKASVKRGRFAAWWPAGEARADNPEVTEAPTFTVTLADGTRHNTTG